MAHPEIDKPANTAPPPDPSTRDDGGVPRPIPVWFVRAALPTSIRGMAVFSFRRWSRPGPFANPRS